MKARLNLAIGLIILCNQPLRGMQSEAVSGYSTCPSLEQAVIRSVAYVSASEKELRKWATFKPNPSATGSAELIRVKIQVDGERVFCGQALNGPIDKQRAAVTTAMQWQFKKHRPPFKNYLMGEVGFRF